LNGRFALTPQRLAVDGLRLDAAGANLTGSAVIALPSALADGKFDLAATDLSGLSGLAGTKLAGRLQGRVQLASARGKQTAEVTLSARQLKSGDAHVASANLTAALSDLTRAPRGRLTIGLVDAGSAGMTLARVTVTADGALDQLGWSITAQGQARQRFTLDASGQASTRGDTGRLAVQRLTGQFGTIPIRLEQATSLQRAADSLVLAPMQLDLGRGRLRIAASRRGAQLAGTLELKDLPLDLAHVIASHSMPAARPARAAIPDAWRCSACPAAWPRPMPI
jgi:autotransporter translocation and assembly factor TamB